MILSDLRVLLHGCTSWISQSPCRPSPLLRRVRRPLRRLLAPPATAGRAATLDLRTLAWDWGEPVARRPECPVCGA